MHLQCNLKKYVFHALFLRGIPEYFVYIIGEIKNGNVFFSKMYSVEILTRTPLREKKIPPLQSWL